MSDESQITVPPSFVALFIPERRIKPCEPKEVIAQRYELCEDFAQMLVERAQTLKWELGITEDDVLQRIGAGHRHIHQRVRPLRKITACFTAPAPIG